MDARQRPAYPESVCCCCGLVMPGSGGGVEGDSVAETFELADEAAGVSFGASFVVEPVGAEVTVASRPGTRWGQGFDRDSVLRGNRAPSRRPPRARCHGRVNLACSLHPPDGFLADKRGQYSAGLGVAGLSPVLTGPGAPAPVASPQSIGSSGPRCAQWRRCTTDPRVSACTPWCGLALPAAPRGGEVDPPNVTPTSPPPCPSTGPVPALRGSAPTIGPRVRPGPVRGRLAFRGWCPLADTRR